MNLVGFTIDQLCNFTLIEWLKVTDDDRASMYIKSQKKKPHANWGFARPDDINNARFVREHGKTREAMKFDRREEQQQKLFAKEKKNKEKEQRRIEAWHQRQDRKKRK